MTDVNVPSYIIDRNGVIAWLNPAAESIVGDVRGQRFTDVVAVEDRPRAKEAFARKIVGKRRSRTPRSSYGEPTDARSPSR